MTIKLTPSRVREWQLCPHQFQLKYVAGLAPSATEISAPLSFGQSLHAVLEALHENGSAQLTPNEIPELLRLHWNATGYASPEQEAAQFALGVSLLQNYLKRYGSVDGVIVALEIFLARFMVHEDLKFELVCRADRIELQPDGTLEVLDYKTNADGHVLTAADLSADLPTFIYYLLTRVAYPKYPRVKLSQLNLVSLNKTTIEYSAAQRAQHKTALLTIVREIGAAQFLPRAGVHCSWCSVRPHCQFYNTVTPLTDL